MTQKEMIQPLSGICHYGRKKLTVNKEEKIMGREKRLENSRLFTCIKQRSW
jgi:hypothetical protein